MLVKNEIYFTSEHGKEYFDEWESQSYTIIQ